MANMVEVRVTIHARMLRYLLKPGEFSARTDLRISGIDADTSSVRGGLAVMNSS